MLKLQILYRSILSAKIYLQVIGKIIDQTSFLENELFTK